MNELSLLLGGGWGDGDGGDCNDDDGGDIHTSDGDAGGDSEEDTDHTGENCNYNEAE